MGKKIMENLKCPDCASKEVEFTHMELRGDIEDHHFKCNKCGLTFCELKLKEHG